MFKTENHTKLLTDDKDFLEVEYPVMEHFYTIQGEGAHTGRASYFIRTAGCDVNCWWCDVKDSWEEEGHPKLTVGELVDAAKESGAPFVVITGGEPLLHDLLPLTLGLKSAGLQVHIETSGSSPLSGQLDWITLSPKRFKKPTEEVFAYVDELKVVVLTNKDLKWAEENAEKCPAGTRLLLQPEWETPKSIDLIVDYVKENPEWGISLQTHKFLKVP
ncbi:7-carboxy-7-deazaguanine synthase QueE [Gracilimonas sediminicola]|uniref:7-carboxy-7-deazaguanine synthase n=1 Tax=Gracilimonas sediminicola TaxID=2952158 RepID=A0A9X2L5G4_9BACT|nr:7-carboxy-7-deazaguanine synthase QueE [Gracilimonas sediminicola]MCP9292659.1 7-carboxy-7-deazaguanine synthase QueE [Gracilimonas sediminicola]